MNSIEDVIIYAIVGRLTIYIGTLIATFLLNTGRGLKAIQLCKECLIFLNNEELKKQEKFVKRFKITCHQMIFRAYRQISDYTNAVKYGRELLPIYREFGESAEEGNLTMKLAEICGWQCKYAEAQELYKKAIIIMRETGNRKGEGIAYGNLGVMSSLLCKYIDAIECHEKALAIKIETDDRRGKAANYSNLGIIFQILGKYVQAREYHEKALAITIEIGDRNGEASVYNNLGTVFEAFGESVKAKEYHQMALAIETEIGDVEEEAASYGNLGCVLLSLGEFVQGIEYLEKALAILKEFGDRNGEATCYGNLGTAFQHLGKPVQAKEYLTKALAIRIEIGDKQGEATDYGSLGVVFESLGEYAQAKEYLKKALAITMEIGDREGKASSYRNLGNVSAHLGEYAQAKEYHDKALAISTEIGDRKGRAASYGSLGVLFQYLAEYVQARDYFEKALAISIEIGHREEQAAVYGNLGVMFQYIGKCIQAKEYQEKALAIRIEIGDRHGEAASHLNLGFVFQMLGEYAKAKEHLEKALAIYMEIGNRHGVAVVYENMGTLFHLFGEYGIAAGYFKRALLITKEIGDLDEEFVICCTIAMMMLFEENVQEAVYYLRMGVNLSEKLRGFLQDNDQFKISLSDNHDFAYQNLSVFFCFSKHPNNALYVLELRRGRALTDLMAAQYSVERQMSAKPLSWIGIENIMKKESNCTCLYISYYGQKVFLWILTTTGVIYFRRKTVNENNPRAGLRHAFAKSFRNSNILPDEDCEDRSLNMVQPDSKSTQEEGLANLRLVEDNDEDSQNPEPILSLCYKMLIAPVADLLVEPEIIIVPDRALYQVTFAALRDEDGKYLSETFRIRIVPSLTTLKLIQDSPADYHSQAGALIVGDPVVGRVLYKGRTENITPLPCARKEAEMIGQLLGVQPLLGEHATKQAVLQIIHSVSLIHFAAHGNAERGEIALSPVRTTYRTPQEEEYLLTMSDISQVQLRAKLVVLSCCHSGRGQIRAEEVVGIARAFLGSGARSVLVALWALEDRATEQLMRRFYEHLVRGESASESLHDAMKWMRCNGYSDVGQWAPFMLIGDNVRFDFGKVKEESP